MSKKNLTICVMVVVIFCLCLPKAGATIVFDDGLLHIINYTINEAVQIYDTSFWEEPTTVHLVYGGSINNTVVVRDTSEFVVFDGTVDEIISWNRSNVEISGGIVDELKPQESSSVNILGGYIGGEFLWVYHTAQIDFSGGEVGGEMYLTESGYLNMIGGLIDGRLSVTGNSEAIVSGGIFGEDIHLADNGVLTIVGSNFFIDGQPAPYGTYDAGLNGRTGVLEGILANGDPINNTVEILMDSTLILAIPEPSTLLLLGLGAVMLRKRR